MHTCVCMSRLRSNVPFMLAGQLQCQVTSRWPPDLSGAAFWPHRSRRPWTPGTWCGAGRRAVWLQAPWPARRTGGRERARADAARRGERSQRDGEALGAQWVGGWRRHVFSSRPNQRPAPNLIRRLMCLVAVSFAKMCNLLSAEEDVA